MENLRINLTNWLKISLFNRLGLLVIVFTIALTTILYLQFEYSFTTQDTIIDAHEYYYYSKMVESWGNPPDTVLMKDEVTNLKMLCGIFIREENEAGIAIPGSSYWSNLPKNILIDEMYSWSKSTYLSKMHKIEIPLVVIFGDINDYPVTVVDNGNYLFYLVIDYISPSELNNIFLALPTAIIFIFGLYFFIRRYLKPVELMKNRIDALEEGDLISEISIIGEDELAELSKSMNKLIKEINSLLENKHQLLLDVSHELRSPMARMQLLIEMLPEHKNNTKLREEINFLENMLNNLLLSDRLSMPYSTLKLEYVLISEIVEKILDMFPKMKEKINIHNISPNEKIRVDETKFIIALRNLIDNAIKYSRGKKVILNIEKNDGIKFHVQDSGIGISDENIKHITTPFFQADQSVSTKGFGLGLAICKKIIESHKGRLFIQSKIGQGSTFTLHLPSLPIKG